MKCARHLARQFILTVRINHRARLLAHVMGGAPNRRMKYDNFGVHKHDLDFTCEIDYLFLYQLLCTEVCQLSSSFLKNSLLHFRHLSLFQNNCSLYCRQQLSSSSDNSSFLFQTTVVFIIRQSSSFVDNSRRHFQTTLCSFLDNTHLHFQTTVVLIFRQQLSSFLDNSCLHFQTINVNVMTFLAIDTHSYHFQSNIISIIQHSFISFQPHFNHLQVISLRND